jgi:hypothetical protein
MEDGGARGETVVLDKAQLNEVLKLKPDNEAALRMLAALHEQKP